VPSALIGAIEKDRQGPGWTRRERLMNQEEAQALFQKFAAPLAPYVTSAARKEAAESLARSLWLALVTGPEIEETVWRGLKDTARLDDDLIEALKQCYEEKMKPVVSGEQLAALRQRYKVERKA
jgi:hypothetical protein